MRLSLYQDFLSEKILESLLLESAVVYSSKFKNILKKMKDNKIATELLNIENKDLNVTANFFDIKIDDTNNITFTNDRTAQSIIKSDKEVVKWTGNRGAWLKHTEVNLNIFQTLGYEVELGTPVYQPNNNEFGEIISKWTSPTSSKTWCYIKFEGGEGVYNQARLKDAKDDLIGKVFSSSRQEIRTGRAIRLILNSANISYTASDIEKFINEFRGTVAIINDVFNRFEVVDGEDLLFWYHRKNYENQKEGRLAYSCQAVGRRDWLEIYIDNPDTVKLLILKSLDNPDKIIGRALLWKLNDGKTLMDYIYTTKDSDVPIFKEYAKSKNFIIKEDASWSEKWEATMKVKPEGYEKYPSIDTMRYWNPKTGKISNKCDNDMEEIYWSEDHDGGDEDYDED